MMILIINIKEFLLIIIYLLIKLSNIKKENNFFQYFLIIKFILKLLKNILFLKRANI